MAVNSTVEQKPLGIFQVVGQPIIFTVSNQPAVANETRVKFCAEVHIGTSIPNTANSNDLKGVFKTTPNSAGVGMFDLRNVVENYVKADNMAADGSAYKSTLTSTTNRHPIHLIDEFSLSDNLGRYMVIQFYVEYLDTDPTSVDYNTVRKFDGTVQNAGPYFISNGYLKHTDILERAASSPYNDYGYNLERFFLLNSDGEFLTNAPTTQYANINDYGTLSLVTNTIDVNNIILTYYDSTNTFVGSEQVVRNSTNGAWDNPFAAVSKNQILHFGCFPANLRGDGTTTFAALVSTIEGGYITIQARAGFSPMSKQYRININCPNTKGYESIRLCWLNQWGAWDYYTFTKKSSKSISTQGSTYQQLGGTWNESTYNPDNFKGGKKSFRVNATEKISMNTGFVSEADNVMFEELINSPEVYELQPFQTDVANSLLNQYVTPVMLTTSSFTRKTIANDRLMQYTFEIEKSNTLRTQAI